LKREQARSGFLQVLPEREGARGRAVVEDKVQVQVQEGRVEEVEDALADLRSAREVLRKI